MKIAIGRTVHYRGDARNGTDVYPAMITRVWSGDDTRNELGNVDLTLFPPGASPGYVEHIPLADTDTGASYCCWAPDYEQRR